MIKNNAVKAGALCPVRPRTQQLLRSFSRKDWSFVEYLSHSPAETEELGARLGAVLAPGAVVAYRGGLGMGKTAFTRGLARGLGSAFTRGLARGLGCMDRVTSPTFTIVNEYEGTVPLFHFDMYRLADADALFDIGWEDYLDRGGVCAVEWSEQVPEALPPESIFVTIQRCLEHEDWRAITIEGVELP